MKGEREYRYQCFNRHEWVSKPAKGMVCPTCQTVTIRRLKPAEGVEEAIARELWRWNVEFCNLKGFPFDDLIEPTKDDLRAIARRLLPLITENDRERPFDGGPIRVA